MIAYFSVAIHRAVKALQMLSSHEKRLLEDHLIEGVTLERLGRA